MYKAKVFLPFLCVFLFLVGCDRVAKTEHWKIQVTGTTWLESTSAVEQMLKNAGYPRQECCLARWPYLVVQVTITNDSKTTLDYGSGWGTFYAFIADEQGNIYDDVNAGLTIMENNHGTLIPGKSITDIWVFSIPNYSGKLEMRIRENERDSIEVSIPLSVNEVP